MRTLYPGTISLGTYLHLYGTEGDNGAKGVLLIRCYLPTTALIGRGGRAPGNYHVVYLMEFHNRLIKN